MTDVTVEDAVADIQAVYDVTPLLNLATPLETAAANLVALLAPVEEGGTHQWPDIIHAAGVVEQEIERAHAARLETPKLLEVTGNVEERELAARLCEQKAASAGNLAKQRPAIAPHLEVTANAFLAMAQDFRQGLHLPEVVLEGRIIPYNESNDTGTKHESALRLFFTDVHLRNVKAGWWTDIDTGAPKKRSPGELLILMVTEMAEAYEGWLQGCADDKLPQFPALGVEMGDLAIRMADFCGALLAGRIIQPDPANNPGDRMFKEICEIAWRYEAIRKTPAAIGDPETADFLAPQDVAMMIDGKLAFNATREDHKIENRLKEDGKRT